MIYCNIYIYIYIYLYLFYIYIYIYIYIDIYIYCDIYYLSWYLSSRVFCVGPHLDENFRHPPCRAWWVETSFLVQISIQHLIHLKFVSIRRLWNRWCGYTLLHCKRKCWRCAPFVWAEHTGEVGDRDESLAKWSVIDVDDRDLLKWNLHNVIGWLRAK